MIKTRLIDTNLIIRHLVQDDDKAARAAGRLFEACDKGQVEIILLPAVLAECVFVLESFYKHPRGAIAATLTRLISSSGVNIIDPQIHDDALHRYQQTSAHFVDCLLAATAARRKIPVASFDQDFRQFADVTVELA